MSVVLDYANWRPPGGAKQLKAAGVVGVVRYIKPARFQWPKALTPLELMDLAWNGLGVAFNYENGTGDYRGGYAAGAQAGAEAQEAMSELSQGDPDVPVYVSIDTDVPVSAVPLAVSYVQGFYSTCHHRGVAVYGEGLVIARCRAVYGWLSESTSFPGDATARVVLAQHYGQSVPGLPGAYDVNTAQATDWGQIPRPHAPAPTPEAKVKPQYSPPRTYSFVSQLELAGKGAWGLQPDWGVITLAGPFGGSMLATDQARAAVKGRTAALIVPAGTAVVGAAAPLKAYPSWALYECIATSGERYLPPEPK